MENFHLKLNTPREGIGGSGPPGIRWLADRSDQDIGRGKGFSVLIFKF